MRKFFVGLLALMVTASVFAVPARRGWQTRTQADGTQIEVQQFGDEFYHYMINRDGKQVREVNGMYVEVGEAPTAAQVKARRSAGQARRQRKEVGTTPNLAPKGVVILVNFSNKSMQADHTQATFDELCNSLNCTVNDGYPSAGQYFADQSNGAYRPQFDVFGPVNLTRNVAYYGTDVSEEGDDQHATDAVVEGCRLADEQFSINWADYDSDSDGYVDFVYVIYAGKGQADGGTSETIWPHNWSVESARYYGNCTYTEAQCKVGGKKLDNYACSGEMSGNSLGGIGTLCHEFGHVMGLPDLYDTEYGTNYSSCLTPNDWNIMDGGSYNGDGHCPPNYDPWEKDFFGWHKPINLGNTGQNVTLYANGTDSYQAYQITTNGSYISPTTSGVRYYIENRQAQGWDAPLTGHGMLLWKVNFNASKWTNNEPNNTANNPYYTVVSAYGTKIGWDRNTQTDFCPQNPFPGTGNKTSYTGISGKPLKSITETNGIISLIYIEEPANPVTCTWMANGEQFDQTTGNGKVVLPENKPADCESGKVFVGWTKQTSITDGAKPTDLFTTGGQAVTEATTYYAVYATQEGEGGAAFDGTTGGTFKIYADIDGTKYYATTVSNNKLQSTTKESEATNFTLTAVEGGFTIQDGEKYLKYGSQTNISSVTTEYTWKIETGSQGSWRVNATTGTNRALVFRTKDSTKDYYVFGGYATGNINGTEYYDLEIGEGGNVSYSDYSLECGAVEDCELTGITLNTDNVQKEFTIGDEFNADGLIVTAQFSNCADKNVTDFEIETEPDMSSAGTQTITVSYTDEEDTKTAEYEIEVKAPEVYTIRFFNNGEQIGQDQEVTEGQQPEKPADPVAKCENYTFVGWATDDVDETTIKPDLVTDFTAIQNQDYFAVFSRTETTEGEGSGAYIIFKTADADKTAQLDSAGIAAFIESENGIDSFYGDKLYEGQYGLKFGNSKGAGEYSIGLVDEITTNTITLETHTYGTDATTLSIQANYMYSFGEAQTVKDGTITFTVDEALTFNQITIRTNGAKKRAYVKSITIGEGGASSTTYYTTSPECDEPETFTIRFFNNGEQVGQDQEVTEGESPEIPADPQADCEKYTFFGWATAELEETTNQPERVTDFIATQDQDYFAIYSKVIGDEGATYYTSEPDCTEPICELQGITVNVEHVTTSFDLNEEFYYDGLVVTAHYSNCDDKVVTDYIVETPDMSIAGEKEVFVSYTENGVTKTNSYFITVLAPETFTIRFFDNGAQIGQDQEVTEGEYPEIPADPEAACEKYTFFGWATAELEKTTNQPALVTDFVATQNQDYFAIFSRDEEDESGEGIITFYTSFENCGEEAIEEIITGAKALKVLENGMIIILRDGAQYTIFGQKIK